MTRADENVELVRLAVEAFRSRDVDKILEYWHEDAEWRPALSPGGLEHTTYVGHDGLRQWLAELAESWGTFEVIDPEIEAVGDRVLLLAHVHVRGSTSGAEMDVPLAQVWEIDNGKTRRLTAFPSHAAARAAVGRAMSQENVEVVRALTDAYGRGDYESALTLLDERVELSAPGDITGGGEVWRGREGVREGVARFLAVWEGYHYESRSVTECGDHVLEEGFQRARGRGSGVEVAEPFYTVWTVQAGRVTRLQMFRDRDQALQAVGLAE